VPGTHQLLHLPVASKPGRRDWSQNAFSACLPPEPRISQGWLFRRVTLDGALNRHGLAAESVCLILKQQASDAGHRDKGLARIMPHSLRAGCIIIMA